MIEAFVWFTDDDREIVGDDICSKCRLTIAEDEVPLMLFREHQDRVGKNSVDVARFHERCADELIVSGVITLRPQQ
jgi:hypothetical protein